MTVPSPFTLVLNHPGALRRMFLPPSDLRLGEAYIYGDFDVEGDLVAAFRLAEHLWHLDLGAADWLWLGRQLLSLPNTRAPREGRQAAQVTGAVHSRARDRQAISYHYDVSNDSYGLWLDRRMVYSCAYFANADDDLDTAQERKLEYICRKLRLAGVRRRQRRQRVEEVLALVALQRWANHRPFELSGGQQQRLAIARAISTRPALILADEPTGELDSATGRQILTLLRRIVDQEGATVLIATHDLTVDPFADSVYHLKDGLLDSALE